MRNSLLGQALRVAQAQGRLTAFSAHAAAPIAQSRGRMQIFSLAESERKRWGAMGLGQRSMAMQKAFGSLRIPKVPKGFWEKFWPDRQIELVKFSLRGSVVAFGYITCKTFYNISAVGLAIMSTPMSALAFSGGLGGGVVTAGGMFALHRMLSVSPDEVVAVATKRVTTDFRLERVLGGNLAAGYTRAYAMEPACVYVEKRKDKDYLHAFKIFGNETQALITCEVEKVKGSYKFKSLVVEIPETGEKLNMLKDSSKGQAEKEAGEDSESAPSVRYFAGGQSGGAQPRLPLRSIQISNLL